MFFNVLGLRVYLFGALMHIIDIKFYETGCMSYKRCNYICDYCDNRDYLSPLAHGDEWKIIREIFELFLCTCIKRKRNTTSLNTISSLFFFIYYIYTVFLDNILPIYYIYTVFLDNILPIQRIQGS